MISMPGCLYVVATPIGNLEDITIRAVRILGEVQIIACEDTRRTRNLLARYNISKPLVSYHDHNELMRSGELISKLRDGDDVALVSDAGTPLISDPGYRLVTAAIAEGIPVVPIPGPSAAPAALVGSGLPADEYYFAGFLPSRSSQRRRRLNDLKALKSTLVMFEAPHRIKQTLRDALEILGDRPAALARELTKVHEEFSRGSLSEIERGVAETEARGEYVLIIGAQPDSSPGSAETEAPVELAEEVDELIRTFGISQNEALKQAARRRGINRADAYRQLVEQRNRSK